MFGIILGDNYSQVPRTSIGRSNGSHRIASILRKKNVDVEVIDFFNDWTMQELKQFIKKFNNIDFIGISIGLGVIDEEKTNKFIKEVKKIFIHVKIIVGGLSILDTNFKNVDIYFKGFAEGAVDDIIIFLKTGKFDPFKIQTIKNPTEKKIVDCMKHYPTYDLSNLKTSYTDSDFIHYNETLALETSRGCIFKCKFCNFPLIGKNKNDYIREKENIKEEILENYRRWKVTKYFISDDTFNDNELKVNMLHEISKEIDFQLSFMCYARIDILRSKKQQLEKMIDFGVKGVFFGFESLNEQSSKLIGKNLTGDKLKEYLLEIKKTFPKLHITGSFIIGLPYESIDTFKNNINWAIESKTIDSICIYPLRIPVNSSMNNLSAFSLNFKDYGYNLMTKKEVLDFINSSDHVEEYNKILDKSMFTNHKIYHPWKNETMNFLESELYTLEIKKQIRSNISVSGWFKFAQSLNEPNLENFLFKGKTETNWKEKILYTEHFINCYKKNKLMI